jgi:hypothetical protein
MPGVICHFPITVRVTGELTEPLIEEAAQALEGALGGRFEAARRAPAGRGLPGGATELTEEPFDPNRFNSESSSYSVPSYERGGKYVALEVAKPTAQPQSTELDLTGRYEARETDDGSRLSLQINQERGAQLALV